MAELQREEIPSRIRQARKEAGLTQPEIADLLGVAMRTYQNYESDRVPWSLINEIAKVTGKEPEWLLHGDPKPSPDLMANLGRGDQLDRIERRLEEIERKLDYQIQISENYISEARRTEARRAVIAETVSELDSAESVEGLTDAFRRLAAAEPDRSASPRPSRAPGRRKQAPA